MWGWVCVKPGSCGALCTWSTLKTSHNIELTDTAAHEQDWDPLTNHRTVNRRSTEPWASARRAEGRGCLTVKKKASQQTEDELKGSPRKTKKRQRCRTTTERQEEVEEAAELWRLQETSARHKNNREEGESQTVITRQHEVLSNTLQGGNSERNEKNQKAKRKETEETQTEQTTAHSPLILQGCNSHTHWQPRFSQKNITSLFGSVDFSQQCQQKVTFIRIE